MGVWCNLFAECFYVYKIQLGYLGAHLTVGIKKKKRKIRLTLKKGAESKVEQS